MKDMRFLKENLIAHRGLHQNDLSVAENSMTAFRHALEHGYDIELDITLLKDGTLVVFHDKSLKRLCGIDLNIADLSYDDIKDMTLLNTNDTIPLLKDVLELVSNKVSLLIEIKPYVKASTIGKALVTLMANYPNTNWAVFSFSPQIVRYFKKHHPSIIRGQIAQTFKRKELNFFLRFFANNMLYHCLTKPDFISYRLTDMPTKKLDTFMKKGGVVISFCARNQDEFDFVKSRYHNTVFEFFEPIKKALPKR